MLHVVGGAGFHLDETEDVLVPGDQVDLAVVAWGAEVPGNDRVALPAEVEVGVFFALAAYLLASGSRVGGEECASQSRVMSAVRVSWASIQRREPGEFL